MSDTDNLTPIQKLGIAQDRIKELEAQVIQAEDIAKEMMDEHELHKVQIAEQGKVIANIEYELAATQRATKEYLYMIEQYNRMNFFQRLWWAFTQKVW